MLIITDQKLYRSIWDKIYQDYRFSAQSENWLRPDAAYDVYRLGALWDEMQERTVNQILCRTVATEMYALDWQHDCFLFRPDEYIPYGYQYDDRARDCTVYFPSYYPDGDYHFFVSTDWTAGLFGHPWRKELIVTGDALRREIAKATAALNLEKAGKA